MTSEAIEIHAGDLDRPYNVLGPIRARVQSLTRWSRPRTTGEVDAKLREAAMKVGANAVINVSYVRGITMTSWKALTATGTAVVATGMHGELPASSDSTAAHGIREGAFVTRTDQGRWFWWAWLAVGIFGVFVGLYMMLAGFASSRFWGFVVVVVSVVRAGRSLAQLSRTSKPPISGGRK